MKRTLLLVLVVLALLACGIDFVEVEDAAQAGHVLLRTDHGGLVEASLEVSLPGNGPAPLVSLGGSEVFGEAEDGRWWYRASPVVDTLQPSLALEIRTSHDLVIALPFVTRNGPAVRRQNGDLQLPVTYSGDPDDPRLMWRVALFDSIGQQLVTIQTRSAPLPSPIVLNTALVPPAAATAVITTSRHDQREDAPYPLSVATESTVWVPLPDP